jgi:hypothetical protein
VTVVDGPTDPVTFEEYSALQRSEYEAGDKAALLQMILLCVQDQRPLPDWAGTAFEELYHWVITGGARSWDDAFGNPHPKKKHVHSIRLEKLKWKVHTRVRDIHEKEGVPIDEKLFERVGIEMGIGGKTVVNGLYYKVESILRRLRDEDHCREF